MDDRKILEDDDLDDVSGGMATGISGEDCFAPKQLSECVGRECLQMFSTPRDGTDVHICLKHNSELK
jgi:hypothetical protein